MIPNKTGIFDYNYPFPKYYRLDRFIQLDYVYGEYVNLVGSAIRQKSNREINPAVLSNLSLQKMTYPTGGNQTFYYEPNSFDNKEDYIDKSEQNS